MRKPRPMRPTQQTNKLIKRDQQQKITKFGPHSWHAQSEGRDIEQTCQKRPTQTRDMEQTCRKRPTQTDSKKNKVLQTNPTLSRLAQKKCQKSTVYV